MLAIKRFIRDKKGVSEAIGFLATILLLMLVILNIWPPVKYVLQELVIENVNRVTLMEMEEEGGFTTDIKNKAIERLTNFGFDESKIEVTSTTPKPIQWGNEINLTIRYVNDYKQYSFSNFALSQSQEDKTIEVTRSSVSREYFK
ncbi:DUF4320 family protein [Ferviditalea candida]|uniref:DUF4320 family protein n=1 Tax=Ferviditalea candida TaxID=3108399 RepID=A0ABU5ZN95_9BACL|nr:DUF4320 family protein [Paenibacillaceae bacterium T2]